MELFSEKHTTPDGIEISFKRDQRGMWNPRVLVLYQGKWGNVDPERRAVRFQGIPGGVARGSIPGRIAASTQSGVPSVPGKIPGGMTSCLTPVRQQAGVV